MASHTHVTKKQETNSDQSRPTGSPCNHPAFSITDSEESEMDELTGLDLERRKKKLPKIKVDSQDVGGSFVPDNMASQQISPPTSPVTQQNMRYVEEEGEVFRRKTIPDNRAEEADV